ETCALSIYDGAQRALEGLLDDLGERVLLGEEALGGTTHAVVVAAHLEVDGRLDGDLHAVLVDALDGDADLTLLEGDREALLEDRPHEDAAADDDALAADHVGLVLARAAADDDECLVRWDPSDALGDEGDDREERDREEREPDDRPEVGVGAAGGHAG